MVTGLEKASQLLEVKAALEQLSFSPGLHSSTSTYSRQQQQLNPESTSLARLLTFDKLDLLLLPSYSRFITFAKLDLILLPSYIYYFAMLD